MKPQVLALCIGATFLAPLGGCGPVKSHVPVPLELSDRADVPGMAHVRTWGDHVDELYKQSLIDSILQEEAYYAANPHLMPPSSTDVLLISGGGENGAFGAGLLKGWSEAGDRPVFKLVTGVSTGALIAPFAFLGPEYDDELEHVYTGVAQKDIAKQKGLLAILRDDSLADTRPLAGLLDRLIDEALLAKVAAEHDKGRRLLIGTTNLDAQRGVIWNMGEIAKIGTPESEQLFQQVMLASASIPGAFPPQYISVEADGKPYDEMHVDGGTVSQVFLWGAGFTGADARRALGRDPGKHRPGRMFIIRNGVFHPEYETMEPLFVDIAGRAVSTLIKYQGAGDMFRLYLLAEREGGEYNLAFIPPSFDTELKEPFDPQYMRALFDFGYEQAKSGYSWKKSPPVLDLTEPHRR